MNEYLNNYYTFLRDTKKSAANTLDAYIRDLENLTEFMNTRGIDNLLSVEKEDIIAYVMDLKQKDLSSATITRRIASARSFYKYLVRKNLIIVNPTDDVQTPPIIRGNIEYLSIEEMDKLLALPDDTVKGMRDKAILEVLYGTGVMVTEIVEMSLGDANMRMGFITCNGNHGKARIVPLGDFAKEALKKYLKESRPQLLKEQDASDQTLPLFLNFMGKPFTRQGLWKILSGYGKRLPLNCKLTPQTIRHSFAVHMIENGADLKTLQELMGHEDIAATQVYLKFKQNKIKEVYDHAHPRAVYK